MVGEEEAGVCERLEPLSPSSPSAGPKGAHGVWAIRAFGWLPGSLCDGISIILVNSTFWEVCGKVHSHYTDEGCREVWELSNGWGSE